MTDRHEQLLEDAKKMLDNGEGCGLLNKFYINLTITT